MLTVSLPDGSEKTLEQGQTGFDLANSISKSLAKQAIAIEENGVVKDLHAQINNGSNIKIIKAGDKKSYEILRHSASHILAAVVQKLYPQAKVGIGPATENGFFYDFQIADHKLNEEDLEKISKEMKKFASGAYQVKRRLIEDPQAKQQEYEAQGEIYKSFLLEKHITEDTLTEYYFTDSNGTEVWSDFCAGPHIPNTKFIKHFALTNVAGAYWLGDVNNTMMQRVYGTVWWSDEELKAYFKQKEESEARDHRKLAKQHDLFSTHELAGSGLIFWHPNLATIRHELENFWYTEHRKDAYEFVITPHIAKSQLWDTSGHNSFYKDNMYNLKVDEEEYVLKPMNCPFHVLIFQNARHSYRELPVRMAEMGTVYRNEASGAVHGLARVRGFTQDDAHIFCTREQFKAEIQKVYQLIDRIYGNLGLTFEVEVSTKPEKAIGEAELWSFAEQGLMDSLNELKVDYEINPQDGAFYGPKIDFKLKDALGRVWQGATIQLDFNLPERFDLNYIDKDGENQRPVMIHRAIFGSMERISMVLIEHYAGAFPTWLAPKQVSVIPVTDKHNEYAEEIRLKLIEYGLRAQADLSSERMNYKIRKAQTNQVPYMLIVGDQEMAENKVNVRCRRGQDQSSLKIDEFAHKLLDEIRLKQQEPKI
jgi:threonyl-tRNA synthetase